MRARGCISSYALCFLIVQVKFSNSRTSWRLNADKVIQTSTTSSTPLLEDDLILDILTGSTSLGNGQGWSRSATSPTDKLRIYCTDCKGLETQERSAEFYCAILWLIFIVFGDFVFFVFFFWSKMIYPLTLLIIASYAVVNIFKFFVTEIFFY